MSLLLCRQENVKHPYFLKDLGIHLYSSQELSYVIFNYPLLMMDDFVDERLLTFLRDELNQGFLAAKLEHWIKAKEDPDELLIMILQECDYYTDSEVSKFRQKLAVIRKKHPAEYGKLKADELFHLKQYGKSEQLYRELLDYPEDSFVDELYKGSIWNNLGACYGRMLQGQKAMDAYEQAYACNAKPDILKAMYCLSRLDEDTKLSERFQVLIRDDWKEEWDGFFEEAQMKAKENAELIALEELFNRDSIKRQAGEMKMLAGWKRKYRSMVGV